MKLLTLLMATLLMSSCTKQPAAGVAMLKPELCPIVSYGAPLLRAECSKVKPNYPQLSKLIADMFFTLDHEQGVGLAAPQVGRSLRLFVVDCSPWADSDPSLADFRKVFINPEIYAYSDDPVLRVEGCISFGDLRVAVPRPLTIKMRYMDEKFVEHDQEFSGLAAWVIQHEYDHVEGVLFIDRVRAEDKTELEQKLANILFAQ